MNKKQHVLVIRISAMGDVAMLVHVVLALIEKYPQLYLHILTQPIFSSFFKDLPRVIILSIDKRGKHKGLTGILRLAREIPDRIDTIADVHDVLRSKILRRVLSMRGLKNEKLDKGRSDKKALISTKNKVIKQLKSSHQRYADVFEKLGFPIQLQPHHIQAKQVIHPQLLKQLQLAKQEDYIGFAPFAAHRSKRLGLKEIKMILSWFLENKPNQHILLFGGGKNEVEALTTLAAEYTNCINIAGKCTFEEELSIISNLKLMLSMDSGNGHLAAIFGVPVCTFWGGTHPYAGFAPFLQPTENQFLPDLEKYPLLPISVYGNKMIDGYEDVMESIDFEAVFKRISMLLKE